MKTSENKLDYSENESLPLPENEDVRAMNNSLKAIIIDDEEAARNVLSNVLDWSTENIEVVSKCNNLMNGIEEIRTHQPDVVFLDVQMPDYAGYEIVRFFDTIDFEIVFVTAYDQYAIKAFEMSALDYLVKPVERSRLNQTLSKIRSRVLEKSEMDNYKVLKEVIEKKQTEKLIISELLDGHVHQRVIMIADIVAIEAMRAYSTLYLRDKESLLVSRNLKSFEDVLPMQEPFIRSHRSWLINSAYVESFSNQNGIVRMKGGVEAKVTKGNLESLQQAMGV